MIPTLEQLSQANNDYFSLRKFISNKEYMSYLMSETSFLESATIKQRLYHLLSNLKEIQKCKCGSPVKWNVKNNTYRTYCSSKCAHTDDRVKLKTENTCLQKYGKKTNLLTPEAKLNYSKKMLEKFGVDNPFKSKNKQEEIKNTIFEKYGVENISKLESIKEKINSTHISRYNRLRQSQSHFSDDAYSLKYNKQALIELYTPNKSIKDIADQIGVGHSQLCIQFKKYGIEVHQTVGQQQLFDFIKSIYPGNIIVNDRKTLDGKEIDIFIPDLNLGFEYDGIFWHSQDSSGKTKYHAEKDNFAKTKGIKLFHIIDLEWQTKQELVKSRISSILGLNKTVFGRKTTAVVLDKSVASKFFNENHIQGNVGACFYAGLEFNNTIVAAMSFGKSRYNSAQHELLRFCSAKGLNVLGGASKLFNFSVKHLNTTEVISFSDIRWGTGKVYEHMGFKHVRDNDPSYLYTHEYKTIENRVKYQKHKLKKILPDFDENLSEWENMKNNGFDRYWNSGNAVYVWHTTT